MTLYVDIAEFVGNPIRTGIQRIVREVLERWPPQVPHVLVRYDPSIDRLVTVPSEAVRYAIDFDNGSEPLEAANRQIAFLQAFANRQTITLEPQDRLLAPELFFQDARCRFYERAIAMGVAVHVVVPDFLVWLRPDTFPIVSAVPLMPYLRMLLACQSRAFISTAVKRVFETRILRRPDTKGLALDLGADGLPLAHQSFDVAKRDLVCLGTLDGRKGQDVVFTAFTTRRTGAELRLVVIGRIPPNPAPCLRDLLACDRADVELIHGASDALVAERLSRARASLYISPAEGYGLPPMECLHAGVPVVVAENLPALEGKSSGGQIRLARSDVASVRAAIETLADDAATEALWRSASTFPSVTWRSVVTQIANWAA